MKIFNYIYYLFLAAVGCIAVLLLVSIFPITGNIKVLVVLSGSMEPAIHTGSIVVVKPSAEYKVGDVITFGKMSRTQTPTTHRIVEVKGSGISQVFVTKGDANNAPDMKEVKLGEVVGKEFVTIPYVGFAINTAKKPWGFAAIIIIPALIVVFDEVKKIYDEVKRIKIKKINEAEKQEN